MSALFNIYMVGVGGQGIGLLAEILARASDYAGFPMRGCDTHGLAQRGGMVSSNLRLGACHSPLVPLGEADLVIALERHEAMRAAERMLKAGGALVWYDACWQPLDVRLGAVPSATAAEVEAGVAQISGRAFKVLRQDLPDSRMQNVAIISEIVKKDLIPGMTKAHVLAAMADIMDGASLAANQALVD